MRMKSLRKLVTGLVFGLLMCAPSLAGLLDNNSEYVGYVSSVQTNYFVVLTPDSQFIRIMLTPGTQLPNLFAGNRVRVVATPGNDGQMYLVKVNWLDSTSTGTNVTNTTTP